MSAAQLVTKSQLLTSGDSIKFHPKQGESFSVTKDFLHYDKGANYDIAMKNGSRLYFENKNQEEDMYIIFNESTDPGDTVILKINQGAFTYTTQSFDALPKTVKKVLRASAERKRHQKVSSKDIQIDEEEFCFDGMGNIVECQSASATVNQLQQPQPSEKIVKDHERESPSEMKIAEKEEKRTGFFDTFSLKIKEALAKITKTLQRSKKSEKREVSLEPQHDIVTQQPEKKVIHKILPSKTEKTNISKYNNLSDQEHFATDLLPAPKIDTLPQDGEMTATFDRMSVSPEIPRFKVSQTVVPQQEVTAPVYHKPDIAGEKKFAPYDNLNQRYTETIDQKAISAPIRREENSFSKVQRPDIKASVPITEHKILTSVPPKSTKPVIRSAQFTPAELPTSQSSVSSPSLSRPHLSSQKVAPSSDTKISQSLKPKLGSSPSVLPSSQVFSKETVSAPVMKSVTPPHSESVAQQFHERASAPDLKLVVSSEVKSPEPVVAETPKMEEEEKRAPSDKIVITKIISKKPSATVPVPIERMSDRVLGGGYGDTQSLGQVGVKAYSNHKPVSAWVEVFKGKRRVKTFYTGSGKLVKLPEGTYVLKSTYRTGTSKQRKNLGKIHLYEGDVIRKKVYFNVGKLTIAATRKKRPLYVKIEIYKKGSRRRYAYTFSSRRTGKANLQLAEGSYKIVVHEHGNKKVFDNVYIKGNASKTLRVDF